MADRNTLCSMVAASGLLMSAGRAPCQEIRVLLIRPADARAIPRDVGRIFQQAIRHAVPDIAFVTRVAEATDIIEFTSYEDDLLVEGKQGITSKWQYCFRPLVDPSDPPAARAGPGNFELMVYGNTRAESLGKSAEHLRTAMQRLLERFRPRVLK
jgi:hypothetical protein